MIRLIVHLIRGRVIKRAMTGIPFPSTHASAAAVLGIRGTELLVVILVRDARSMMMVVVVMGVIIDRGGAEGICATSCRPFFDSEINVVKVLENVCGG